MKTVQNALFTKEIDRINMTFSTVSYAELDSCWEFATLGAPYTRVYLVESGEAKIWCDGEEITLSGGNVYIIPANTPFSCKCEDYMNKIFFHINVLRYNNYDILDGCKHCIVLKEREFEIALAKKLLSKDDVNAVLTMKSVVLNLLIAAIEQEGIQLGKIEEYSESIKKALSLIEKNLSAELRIPDIAEKLYISESRLQKDFKKQIGVPIGKYINDRLMSRALELICENKLPVKEISELLGFCDQFYFSRRFTQYFGVSPSNYKKRVYPKF